MERGKKGKPTLEEILREISDEALEYIALAATADWVDPANSNSGREKAANILRRAVRDERKVRKEAKK